jgi:putative CocE/NonD family hydrolase
MSDTPYEMAVERDVMIAMRDGVHLATDIYRPARGGRPVVGRFPVILERTPYGKSEVSRSERTAKDATPRNRGEIAQYFVRHGYVVAYQDCRGRYGSEGKFTKYLDDGPDGYDTVAWLAKQPWSSGRIGTMGLSYAAHTQAALGCLDPPGLACQFLDSGGFSNAYQSGIRQGGAFELKQATWALKQVLSAPEVLADPLAKAAMAAIDPHAWFARMPWRRGHSPLAAAPDYEAYLFEQWTHGVFDDTWRRVGIWMAGFYERYAAVPMVHISSWYDAYVRTASENYRGLTEAGRGPQFLVFGPWTHGDRSVTFAGDVDFGAEATLDGALAEDYRALRLTWFDRWLKDVPNGVEKDPRLRYFRMGGGSERRNHAGRLDHGGTWRRAVDWPIPDTVWTKLYLGADGSLAALPPDPGAPPLRYDYDPAHPVPTIGGTVTSGEPIMVGGAFDQVEGPAFFGSREPYLPLAARPDVLVFETAPLRTDVEVTGPITVRLWVASSCPDTDFTAKLIDVHPPNPDYPSGYAMNLTDGIFRVRYRRSWERPEMLSPNEIAEIVIEPFATSNLFKAGHRIRLDISSSNFPHFDINPNTGEPEGLARRRQVAVNAVFVDADHPSHIVLPVIPAASGAAHG